MKKLKFLFGITLSGLFLFNSNVFASPKDILYVTTIDGVEHTLTYPSPNWREKRQVLKNLEKAMAESNRITEAYLKTNSPAWKDLSTEELNKNTQVFIDSWNEIVIKRHYNKEVLDAYEKYRVAELKNRNRMYNHFFKLSSNEPFKEKVKALRDNNEKVIKNHLSAIKHLRTYL